MKSKVLAIYLPQFHRIPENDNWWGEGFTEWTNTRRGKAWYPGHYQPREPIHDEYYDLSDLRVLEKHVRMARKVGIAGFCFYHYYFAGRKLLEKPIENYRDFSEETFPYCLIWANQSWSRTWYGATKDNTILLKQTYGEEEKWREHFYYLLNFFKDKRYIKIDNKPVYIIYIPQEIQLRRKMFRFWHELAKENGFAGIYLIAMNTVYGKDRSNFLYDAYMDFEPLSTWNEDTSWRKDIHNWKDTKQSLLVLGKGKKFRNIIFAKNIYSYSYLCKKIIQKGKKLDRKTYAGCFTGWDNTARKDETGMIVTGSTPQKFKKNVRQLLQLSEQQKKRYIFLNAWNEWSEGAYIEPDKRYGYAYLHALRQVIEDYEKEKVMR